jgi:hypothetical protein
MVILLAAQDFNKDATNEKGHTVLQLAAAAKGQRDLVTALLKAGCDPFYCSSGRAPLDIALRRDTPIRSSGFLPVLRDALKIAARDLTQYGLHAVVVKVELSLLRQCLAAGEWAPSVASVDSVLDPYIA